MRIKNRIYVYLLLVPIVAVLGIVGSASGQDRWIPIAVGQPIPVNAAVGGAEQGQSLYLCRGNYKNGQHPGKVVKGNCNITWGGKEIPLVGQGFSVYLGEVRWENKVSGTASGSSTAIVGGTENGGPLYMCQARFSLQPGSVLGTYPGKIVLNRCHVGYAGVEYFVDDYTIAYDATRLQHVMFTAKVYRIVSVKSGKGLDIRGPGPADGTAIQQWGDAKVTNQQWQIQWKGAGFYQIRSTYSNKCIDGRAANLQQWACADVNSQMWRIGDQQNNSYTIASKPTGKVFNLENGLMNDGANVTTAVRNSLPDQRWRFETVITAATNTIGCREQVQGRIAWNKAGNKNWNADNLNLLCQGSQNPNATVACFVGEVARHDDWQRAITACKPK